METFKKIVVILITILAVLFMFSFLFPIKENKVGVIINKAYFPETKENISVAYGEDGRVKAVSYSNKSIKSGAHIILARDSDNNLYNLKTTKWFYMCHEEGDTINFIVKLNRITKEKFKYKINEQ